MGVGLQDAATGLNRRLSSSGSLLWATPLSPLSRIIALFSDPAATGWVYDNQNTANLDWRRNLLTFTEQFDNAAWTKTNATVTANAAVAPDGTMTADKIIENNASTRGRVDQFISATVGNTLSVYAKAAEWTHVSLGITNNSGLWAVANFNLSNGSIAGDTSYGGYSVDTATITPVGDGWYRCSVRIAVGTDRPVIMPFNQAGDPVNPSPALTGDGTSGILIWGAQLEVGSTASAYQRITDVNTEVLQRFPGVTMFQDVAGTVPAISAGQRVRLQLDKSGKGNHRRQPSGDASAPILGRHPAGGRRNLLTFTENLTNATWGKTRATISGTKVAADSTVDATHSVQHSGLTYSGTQSTVSFDASAAEISILFVQMGSGAIAGFNLANGTLTSYSLGSPSATMTSLGSGLYRCTMTATPNSNNLIFFLGEGDGSTLDVTLAGVRTGQGININRFQLELGATATAYQRVTIADDCTETGVADRWYLRADGVDDWLETSAFAWGTDKATVCTGVRKLSDAVGDRVIAELSVNSDSNNGAFRLGTNAATFTWRSRGTVAAETSGAGAQPISAVLTGIGDISGDVARLRRNSSQVGEVLTDQGTGNYGTYPAYFFRRGGSSLPFNGLEYSNIGINRLLTPADLELVEGYVTGVTL